MNILIFFVLIMTLLMVVAKRITSLIQAFIWQSLGLALVTGYSAWATGNHELYVIAVLLLLLKVIAVPYLLFRIVRKIRANEQLGLVVNPLLSLFIAIGLSYLAYLFAGRFIFTGNEPQIVAFVVSLSVTLIGLFIMICRLKALTQIVGLLVMENGLFLAAATMCGSMPFLVEIAIFLDVLMCVIILGIFVYRINELFTHIDVDKLTVLKG